MSYERALVVVFVFLCFSWHRGVEALDGTCGADFLPSSTTDSGTVDHGVQVVLLPAFVGCGRLMRYNVTATCVNEKCNIVFQLWRPTELGVLTLINSAVDSYTLPSNNPIQVFLTFPLDIDFTAGDMIGFSHISGIRPLEVHRASASSHSYLQWSSVPTLRSMLTTEDATTVTSQLPILNVEATCHPCPSISQTTSVSKLMSGSLSDVATTSDGTPNSAVTMDTSSGGQVSSTSNGDSASTALTQPESDAGSLVQSSKSSPATPATSSPVVTTTSRGVSAITKFPLSNTIMSIPIVPTTGGQEGNGSSAGIAAGVVVSLVLAVVLVAVVVAIVLAAVCSTQQRRKRSGQTGHVPADTLLVTDDSGSTALTLIKNPTVPTYDEVKNDMSSGNEAGCVQYDYARPTGVALGTVEHEPSAPVLLTPVYELMSATPCAPDKVQSGPFDAGTANTDEDTYWSPSSKEEEIYAQMSDRKYHEIPRDKVKMLTKLGEGQFGEVYKAVLKSPTGTSQEVAVKLVKKGAPQEETLKLLQEAAILGQFEHNHIVHLVGVVAFDEPPADPSLPVTLLKFCRQVAEGLSYLAGKSFVHRDIAARNILLDKVHNCKLSGFGMARDLSEEDYYTIKAGRRLPFKWTAPEVLFYKKYSTSSDVWSYGMLMYEIWSLGHTPFGDSQPHQVTKLLKERYCQPPPPGCPRAVYKIMVDCWHPDPHCRPAASSLCSSLNQTESLLLLWDQSTPAPSPSAHILGAPLEEGHKLYGDLQSIYQDYI